MFACDILIKNAYPSYMCAQIREIICQIMRVRDERSSGGGESVQIQHHTNKINNCGTATSRVAGIRT